jgi:chorismate mutase
MPSKKNSKESYSEGDVQRLRAKIDQIDLAMLQLIARRKDAALEIAKIKQKIGSQDDEDRMRKILESIGNEAKALGLKDSEIKSIWKDLIAYMIKEQMGKYPY